MRRQRNAFGETFSQVGTINYHVHIIYIWVERACMTSKNKLSQKMYFVLCNRGPRGGALKIKALSSMSKNKKYKSPVVNLAAELNIV